MLRDLLARATLPADSTQPAPSAMLVFAHADDETIGLGARLARYRSAVIVHVTDSAPRNLQEIHDHGFGTREEYAARRRDELDHALTLAGLANVQRISFEIPDQEASFQLVYLIRELHHLLKVYAPEVLFTHPYEGGHPDHDACAFAARRAVSWARITMGIAPTIIEPAFYHLGAEGIETGCFLPCGQIAEEMSWTLSAHEQRQKQNLLACFSTQQAMLSFFPLTHERFRIAPKYAFHEPPHAGQVFYEHYDWGVTARHFCELAHAADVVEEVCR